MGVQPNELLWIIRGHVVTNYERLTLAYLAAIADGVGYLTEVVNPLTPKHKDAATKRVNEWREHMQQLRNEMMAVLEEGEGGRPER